MRSIKALIVCVITFWALGCTSVEPNGGTQDNTPGSLEPAEEVNFEIPEFESFESLTMDFNPDEISAAESMQNFGIDFFARICERIQENNMVVSPLSASILLSMISNITPDETTAMIAKLFEHSDLDAINSISRKYLSCLPKADSETVLMLNNSVWAQQGFEIHPVFEAIMTNYYNSEIFTVDFSGSNSQVIADINRWVYGNTNQMIPGIIDYLSDDCISVFVNALYFHSSWSSHFNQETTESDFYGTKGSTRVPMMMTLASLGYKSTGYYRAVSKTFGNGSYEAVFVMPKQKEDKLVDSSRLKDLAEVVAIDKAMQFRVPRFSVDLPQEDVELIGILEDMGVEGLSGFISEKLFTDAVEIKSKIKHKATIAFNEKGAQGAAVTFSPMDIATDPDIEVITFNRPFIFFIHETKTGNMLFAGKVENL